MCNGFIFIAESLKNKFALPKPWRNAVCQNLNAQAMIPAAAIQLPATRTAIRVHGFSRERTSPIPYDRIKIAATAIPGINRQADIESTISEPFARPCRKPIAVTSVIVSAAARLLHALE
jgi:hypothetical protein